jgi:uncharacterized protein involved in response to NO
MSSTTSPNPIAPPGSVAAPDLLFDDRTTVREILRRFPSTRDVFERAGLMGCGGAQGPDEPLDFFANVHRVPLDALKRSLRQSIETGMRRPRRELAVAPAAPLAFEPVHRYVPFLLSSIALTLTFGATLGMFNLARLTTPWFGAMTHGSVRAHAFVQVFGFVGLFVMGIACHVLPRFAGQPLGASRLTRPMLGLQLAGVVTIAGAFIIGEDVIRWAWVAGSMALIAAGCMFVIVVARTISELRTPERFGRWIIAGAIWQTVAACGSLVAAYYGVEFLQPLWSVALWGFAGSWIFGIGRRIFPGFLGWQPRAIAAETTAFRTYQAGVLFSAAGAWPTAGSLADSMATAGALGLLVAVPLFSWCLGVGTRPKTRHDAEEGYQRFVVAGWTWLVVALATGPLWLLISALRGDGVPPLVTDFARHALAFGFVTQIMMGVATRVLPVFTGNALWSRRAQTATFYLLNASVALRALEAVVAVGFIPAAWPFIAIAGPPALAAVVLFALNVVFTIYGRPAAAAHTPASAAIADRRVSEILETRGALEVLVEAGFTPLKNPAMRQVFAGAVTLRQACALKGVPLEPLVVRLEALSSSPRFIALTHVR